MRTCIFCDRRATTREHALPAWLLKAMAHRSDAATLTLAKGSQASTSWIERGGSRGLKVKHLCSACNNSWLSGLEQRAKGYIRPMMGDVAIPLDREAQAVVSAWIMKTVMVYECLSPKDEWFYSEAGSRSELVAPDRAASSRSLSRVTAATFCRNLEPRSLSNGSP